MPGVISSRFHECGSTRARASIETRIGERFSPSDVFALRFLISNPIAIASITNH